MTQSNDAHDGAAVSSPAAPQDLAGFVSDDAGGASLDKVRDILFGAQMRDYDRRFGGLEERLLKDTTDLREEVRRELGALEQFVKSELDSLSQLIGIERQERVDRLDALSRELGETVTTAEKKTANLDEQLSGSQRDLRQQILDVHQRLSDDMRQTADRVLANLAHEAEELRTQKADRATLATLLTEMAMRLTNELKTPDAETTGNE